MNRAQTNAANAEAPLLDVRGLAIEVSTRKGPAHVVEDLDFSVATGEALGVVGESGCGKSITMLSLMGLLPPAARVTAGTAKLEGRDLLTLPRKEMRKVRGGKVGFVFQDPMTSFNPVMTIGAQLIEPLIYHRSMTKAQAMERAGQLMRLVGIPGGEQRLANYPHELSGGMRQRVMIAMGLACEPSLLIADEPTTALDVTIQAQIVDLVKELRARLGMAVVWITHDLALVSGLVDRIIVLYAGRIVEEAPVDALYRRPSHPYTIGLLASLPRLHGTTGRRLPSIGGTPPEPGRRPKGCAFAPRCAMKVARCEQEEPQLGPIAAGGRHRAACFVAADAARGVAA